MQLSELITGIRVNAGLSALGTDGALSAEAQSWAESMAATDVLQHSPNLERLLKLGFDRAGENVGRSGSSLASIVDGFEASPPHRENMHDPGWSSIGVGVARTPDRQYVVVLFGARTPPPPPMVPRPLRRVRPISARLSLAGA